MLIIGGFIHPPLTIAVTQFNFAWSHTPANGNIQVKMNKCMHELLLLASVCIQHHFILTCVGVNLLTRFANIRKASYGTSSIHIISFISVRFFTYHLRPRWTDIDQREWVDNSHLNHKMFKWMDTQLYRLSYEPNVAFLFFRLQERTYHKWQQQQQTGTFIYSAALEANGRQSHKLE